MTLDPLKLYPREKCDVQTDRRTDGRTDGQTDDGEVIPKCHLCLQQVTQKPTMILENKLESVRIEH